WLFFLLAGAFGAVTLWAVYDESYTRREWKGYQEEFFKIERTLATTAAQDAHDQLYGNPAKKDKAGKPAPVPPNPEYQKLAQEKAGIEQRRKQNAGAIAKAESELQQAKFEFNDKQQRYTFTKSELDETYYFFTVAKHEAHEEEIQKWDTHYKALAAQLEKDD